MPNALSGAGRVKLIEPTRPQLSFAEGLIREEVESLWEEWMRQVDAVLADRELVQIVYQALARRWPKIRTRGRPGTPAEVVLRLLLLKHMRNWSYRVLEREVRANLVYRQFTRVGAEKVPDAKTLGKLAVALGPQIVAQIHQRVVAIAREKQIIRGRRLRVDTTVVETHIHYPTDSSLVGDGVRVLTRTMKRIAQIAGRAGTRLRDRTRTVGYRVMEIARASRSRVPQGQERSIPHPAGPIMLGAPARRISTTSFLRRKGYRRKERRARSKTDVRRVRKSISAQPDLSLTGQYENAARRRPR